MSLELKLHDIGTVTLLSQLTSRYGRDWSEEDKATVNECISHAAVLHDMRAVPVGMGVLSLEPKHRHDWKTDKSGLVDECACGEVRA